MLEFYFNFEQTHQFQQLQNTEGNKMNKLSTKGATTLSIMALNVTTFSIMTLSIQGLFDTLSITAQALTC
jgi:hypothetical protein